MYSSEYSVSQSIVLGILGGVTSAILVFFILGRFLPPVGGIHSVFTVGAWIRTTTGVTGNTMIIALASRMLAGAVIGGIFGATISADRIRTHRGTVFGLGIIAGVTAWIVLSILSVVGYDVLTATRLSYSTIATYLAYSFARYFVFGLIMGALVRFLLPRYATTTVEQRQPIVTQEIQR